MYKFIERPYLRLSPSFRKHLFAFLGKNLEANSQYFHHRYTLDPEHHKSILSLALHNKTVVSNVCIVPKKLSSGLKIVGIADVATSASHRGKGLSSLLMNAAYKYTRKRDYGAMILFTDIPDFYTKLGYKTFSLDSTLYSIRLRKTQKVVWKRRGLEDLSEGVIRRLFSSPFYRPEGLLSYFLKAGGMKLFQNKEDKGLFIILKPDPKSPYIVEASRALSPHEIQSLAYPKIVLPAFLLKSRASSFMRRLEKTGDYFMARTLSRRGLRLINTLRSFSLIDRF